LSQVEVLKIKTADDARQAIFLLELANTCIRLIVGQTNLDEEVRKALLAHSAMIDMRLGAARRDASILKSWLKHWNFRWLEIIERQIAFGLTTNISLGSWEPMGHGSEGVIFSTRLKAVPNLRLKAQPIL
jgi:hypothetical protein